MKKGTFLYSLVGTNEESNDDILSDREKCVGYNCMQKLKPLGKDKKLSKNHINK